jgi:nitronate monooxygenase
MEGGMWWAGQVQGLIHDVIPVRDLVEQIIAEAEEIITKRLVSLVG